MMVMAQPWWPLSPWLSPGVAWFIFFNAVVAAITVMSSCTQQDDRHVPSSRLRLCRSASAAVLDQLRSFSLFPVHPIAGGVTAPPLDDLACVTVSESDYYHCSQEAEVPQAPQVTQVSTVVSETPCSTAPAAGESVRMAVHSVASSVPVATAAAAESASAPESKEEEADAEEEQDRSISLDEAYAMVQQRRPRQSSSAQAASSVATTTAASWLQKTTNLAAKGPKRRRGGEAEEAPEGKAKLNARAELFIRQFRQELKLQRLNSLLRHTHEFGPVDGAPMAVSPVW